MFLFFFKKNMPNMQNIEKIYIMLLLLISYKKQRRAAEVVKAQTKEIGHDRR
jgi:hypothetical protein